MKQVATCFPQDFIGGRGREGVRERRREGERDGGIGGGREGGRAGGREGGKEGGRYRRREGGREWVTVERSSALTRRGLVVGLLLIWLMWNSLISSRFCTMVTRDEQGRCKRGPLLSCGMTNSLQERKISLPFS